MLSTYFKKLVDKFALQSLDLLLPPTCLLCQQPSGRALDLCVPCENDLPRIKHPCHCCGRELSSDLASANQLCGQCLQTPPPFKRCYVFWNYIQPFDYFITRLKFHSQLACARLLGELLTTQILHAYRDDQLPEMIIPVPLHPARLRERGFNQALEIARVIDKNLQIPIDFKSCQRNRFTEAQSSLPAKQRQKNVKDAFSIVKPLPAQHIAVIDDVITTGHTVHEFCKPLQQQNIQRIDVWCCARTPHR